MKLSVIIPARNEEGSIEGTIRGVCAALEREAIAHEVVVVNDGSTDATAGVAESMSRANKRIRLVHNDGLNGFGRAVRAGIEASTGECVAIVMADASDSPGDLVRYFRVLEEGYDCAFGSRFIKGSRVVDYPSHKLFLNRAANWFIRVLFRLPYNDVTNAFKAYRREVIALSQPLIAPHFNLTVELPLKAIVRGCSYKVIPISWTNRKSGISKLKIKEMGSRYLFIVLSALAEKHLSRGDYKRGTKPADNANAKHA